MFILKTSPGLTVSVHLSYFFQVQDVNLVHVLTLWPLQGSLRDFDWNLPNGLYGDIPNIRHTWSGL